VLTCEKRELEKRLAQLRRDETGQPDTADTRTNSASRERRKYPRVYPKYGNPDEPSETWSGRGKQPRWLAAALKTGRTIDEFVIVNTETTENGRVVTGITSRVIAWMFLLETPMQSLIVLIMLLSVLPASATGSKSRFGMRFADATDVCFSNCARQNQSCKQACPTTFAKAVPARFESAGFPKG